MVYWDLVIQSDICVVYELSNSNRAIRIHSCFLFKVPKQQHSKIKKTNTKMNRLGFLNISKKIRIQTNAQPRIVKKGSQ